MSTITIDDTQRLLGEILAGAYDEHLDAISTIVHDRKKELRNRSAKVALATFKPGDKAKLKDVRPKYLVGAPCTIADIKQTRIGVRIDQDWLDRHPQAKARWSGTVVCPANMLERV